MFLKLLKRMKKKIKHINFFFTYRDNNLDVCGFLMSPCHAYFFRDNITIKNKIVQRLNELLETGMIQGKEPIINIQHNPNIVELHDGNASAVAWLLYAREKNIATNLRNFKKSFKNVIVLKNRKHKNGQIWHPYVPLEVESDKLQYVLDSEQSSKEKKRKVKKAITYNNEVAYFNDTNFFSGKDTSEKLGTFKF